MTEPASPDLTSPFKTFQHYTALGFLIGAPVLIALPPRKLDLYTFALGSSFVLSANHLLKERKSQSQSRTATSPFGGRQAAPDKLEAGGTRTRYEIVQEQLRREKADAKPRRLLELPPNGISRRPGEGDDGETGTHGRLRWGIQRRLEEVWMGGEKAGWKERRLAEEQEKISQGEGYGDMIMDQIWEVWNWGRRKGEALEGNKDVLKERKMQEEFPDIVGKE